MNVDTAHWVGLELAGGRYLVRTKLGAGGMGCVYRAWDNRFLSDVVIKTPRPDVLDDKEFAARFAREVRSLVKLAHPHIVKIIDVGEHDKVPFAVLQYLPGGSLRGWQMTSPEGKRLPLIPHDLRGWLVDVADALDFIHRHGCIHRDVKPDNILFDAQGSVFLSDFGVAKVLATESKGQAASPPPTESGHVLGTPQYMAPELLLGQVCDGWADQYALGVTVYELLSGQLPFDGPTPAAIFVQQTTREATPLDTLPLSIPAELAEAVGRAMSREPGHRFPDCATFAKAVITAVTEMTSAAASKNPTKRVASSGTKTAKLNRPGVPALPTRDTSCPCPVCGERIPLTEKALELGRVQCPSCQKLIRLPRSRRTVQARSGSDVSETDRVEPIQVDRPTAAYTMEAPVSSPPATRSPSVKLKKRPAPKRRRWPLLVGLLAVLCLTPLITWLVAANFRASAETPEEPDDPGEMVATPDPPQPPPGPASELTLKPVDPVAIKSGGAAKIRIQVVRQGYNGPIRLFLRQLPAALQAGVVELEEDQDTVDLQLVAAAEAAAGRVTARVMVEAGELKVAPVPVEITVQAPVSPRLEPIGAVTLRNGGNCNIPVKIERHGYEGPITLKIVGLPEHVQAKPATIEADQVTVPLELNALPEAEEGRKEVKLLAQDADGQLLDKTSFEVGVKKISTIRLKPVGDVSVRAGRAKVAFPVQIKREGYVGVIQVKVTGLPEGIDLEEIKPIPGDRNEVDVTLSADVKTREDVTKARIHIKGEGSLEDEVPFNLKVWQLETTAETQRLIDLKSLPVNSIALSYNGRRLVMGGGDALVRVWDMKDPKAAPVLFPQEHTSAVRCVAIDRKQKHVASGDIDGIIRVWDIADKKQVGRFEVAHPNGVECLAFSPDSNWIASGGRDRAVRVWDQVKGQEKGKAALTYPITGITFTPDGLQVITASGFTVVFRRLSDARDVRKLVHSSTVSVRAMALSQAGDRVLTACSDGFIRQWNVSTGEEISKAKFMADKAVQCVAWSGDSNLVLTGSSDGLVRLWDAKTGEEIRRFRGHKKGVTGVALTPDGFSAISSGVDGTVRLWDIPQ